MYRIVAIAALVLLSIPTGSALADGKRLQALLPEPPAGWSARPPTLANALGGQRAGRRYRSKSGNDSVGIFYQWKGLEIKQYSRYLTDPARARRGKIQLVEIDGRKFIWRKQGKSFVFATVVARQVAITLQGLSTSRPVMEGFIKRIKFAAIASAVERPAAGGAAPKSAAKPRAGGSASSFGESLAGLLPPALSGFEVRRKPRWKKFTVGGSAEVSYRRRGAPNSEIGVSYLWRSASVRSRARMFADPRRRARNKYHLIDIGGRSFLIRSYAKKDHTQHYVYARPMGDLLVQISGRDRAAIDAYAKVVPYEKLAALVGAGASGAAPPKGGTPSPKAEGGEPKGTTPPPKAEGGEPKGRTPPRKAERRPPQTGTAEREEGGGSGAGAVVQSCPQNMRGRALARGQALRCACGPRQMRGTVWGTRRYTADSSVCMAARHAGAAVRSGGTVAIYAGSGCPRFVGTTRNGVNSRDWGRFGRTYAFRFPLPRCAGAAAPARRQGTQAGGCDPSVGGKYVNLLRRIRVPRDVRRYGRCRDYGRYSGSSWAGHRNLPPGYWVYRYPHWYIWGRRTR